VIDPKYFVLVPLHGEIKRNKLVFSWLFDDGISEVSGGG
jgi:hypothetical protein